MERSFNFLHFLFFTDHKIHCVSVSKYPCKLMDAYFFCFVLHLTRQKRPSTSCTHPFVFDIIVKLGLLNLGLDNISMIENGEGPSNLDDNLPYAQLFVITMFNDHYRYIIQFLSTGYMPSEFTIGKKR